MSEPYTRPMPRVTGGLRHLSIGGFMLTIRCPFCDCYHSHPWTPKDGYLPTEWVAHCSPIPARPGCKPRLYVAVPRRGEADRYLPVAAGSPLALIPSENQ